MLERTRLTIFVHVYANALPKCIDRVIREWLCISGDGKVTFQQFLTILAIKLKHQPPDEEKEELKEAFMVRMSFNRV